jgi:16S rRNA (cytidine1402-2'-O)-methyltransferase
MNHRGALLVLATPLGNLEDMTFRGVRVLKEAGLVAAEDTRRTKKLFNHYGIVSPLISYREQNHFKALPRIIDCLNSGRNVALVSDAGTPGVSDPGSKLVEAALESGFYVSPIPGPSAVSTVLSVSGFSADHFLFVGFLPAKRSARLAKLREIKEQTATLVLYEAPHRLLSSLEDTADILGDREAVIGREMTKINEEFLRGRLLEIHAAITGRAEPVKGELTVLIKGMSEENRPEMDLDDLKTLICRDGRSIKDIVSDYSGMTSLSRSELYRFVLEARNDCG